MVDGILVTWVLWSGSVLDISEGVPEVDLSVSSGAQNLSIVWGEGNGEDFLGVSLEQSGGGSGSQVPKSEGLVPRRGDDETVLLGEGEVGDEVVVSGQLSVWFSEQLVVLSLLTFLIESPDDQTLISGSGNEDWGILVLLLGES